MDIRAFVIVVEGEAHLFWHVDENDKNVKGLAPVGTSVPQCPNIPQWALHVGRVLQDRSFARPGSRAHAGVPKGIPKTQDSLSW